jgi:GH15 family glucan-1,4-alpha-glucosidase
MTERLCCIAYPSIEQYGVIGDRRSAALVAADGTLDWLCLPNYDGASVCSALLDAKRGGFWRFGPAIPVSGYQRYLNNSVVLVTTWETDDWKLELTDALAWPETDRTTNDAEARVVLRRLRCTRGETEARLDIQLQHDFRDTATIRSAMGGFAFHLGDQKLGLWVSHPVTVNMDRVSAQFQLRKDDKFRIHQFGRPPTVLSRVVYL